MNNDEWREKYGLIETPIDFDVHLNESDIEVASSIVDGVKNINIHGTIVEFGFEVDVKDKTFVVIEAGFVGIKVKREVFEDALKHLHLRDLGIDELKKQKKD